MTTAAPETEAAVETPAAEVDETPEAVDETPVAEGETTAETDPESADGARPETEASEASADNGDETVVLDKAAFEDEAQEATVWVDGLDRLNAAGGDAPGISMVVDLSATPFRIKGSGYPEGQPFPWIVSDFGLVDAIESGITKIPRLPVQDTTGRPDPRYFRLWEAIRDGLQPGEKLPGRSGKPKPNRRSPVPANFSARSSAPKLASIWSKRAAVGSALSFVVIFQGGEAPGLGFAEIDPGRIAEVRAQLPSLANRRAMPRFQSE